MRLKTQAATICVHCGRVKTRSDPGGAAASALHAELVRCWRPLGVGSGRALLRHQTESRPLMSAKAKLSGKGPFLPPRVALLAALVGALLVAVGVVAYGPASWLI